MKLLQTIALLIVIIALLFLGGWIGYTIYPNNHPCQSTVDTVTIRDTVHHTIRDTVPFYYVKLDTVIFRDTVFKDIDTNAILRQFYALYSYERTWVDTLLTVTVNDVISQNKPVSSVFTYRILRPQTVVNNLVNNISYSRYLTLGLSVPLKDVSLSTADLMWIDEKWYGGVGYGKGGLSIKGGVTIFRLR